MNNPQQWAGKRVLITGVCGTVGKELLRQVASAGPAEVIGLDNNESELFFLSEATKQYGNTRLSLADVRDAVAIDRKMEGMDLVIHAAALKHVVLCEESPRDAIQTNIQGTQNVIDAALRHDVERVIFTSSDKAVNPSSVMGTSKLMGERLMTAANALRRNSRPIFASTRFGNVLGSRGSVIPLFKRQIADGGPVTLTHPSMSRFIVTLEDAVRLVLESVFLAKGGEVFVTKMPVLNISDLARVMIEELAPVHGHDPEDVEITVIGAQPGEKMYEELMNEEETRRTIELDRYFAVTPAFKSIYKTIEYNYDSIMRQSVTEPYNSSTVAPMDVEELRGYLRTHGLLEGKEDYRNGQGVASVPLEVGSNPQTPGGALEAINLEIQLQDWADPKEAAGLVSQLCRTLSDLHIASGGGGLILKGQVHESGKPLGVG